MEPKASNDNQKKYREYSATEKIKQRVDYLMKNPYTPIEIAPVVKASIKDRLDPKTGEYMELSEYQERMKELAYLQDDEEEQERIKKDKEFEETSKRLREEDEKRTIKKRLKRQKRKDKNK